MVFIKQINNFLTKEECDFIINKGIHDSTLKESEIYTDKTGSVIDYKLRKSKQSYLDLPEIKERIFNYISNEIKIKGKKLKELEKKFHFLKYDIDSHFNWHTDSNDTNINQRFCTIVIQLNEDYEGGELLYKKDSIFEFERGIGNLYIFNSSLEHAVRPITKGVRYSIVLWFGLIEDNTKTLL